VQPNQWNYLYRAIDDQGLTLDFQLRKKRDFNSAYHFLKRLLKTYGLPHRLVTDQYGATLKAIKKLTREGCLHKGVHQCSKYRNNLIEQDHRFIKRQQVRSASYQSTRTAARTLYGIETMHAIHKESRKKLGLFGFSAYQEVDQLLAA
jgi:putative transposase